MVKKLYKNTREKMICGVCQGLSEYFNIDVTIIRLAFALFGLCAGTGIILYIIAAIIMPDKYE
ncbi:MAG: PspC domain-containing protein [Oscillospiraceae bacterium]|nr:PspC domain-containing protein [Oscillospiraceae bacterium]